MIYACKFGDIHRNGLKDIVDTAKMSHINSFGSLENEVKVTKIYSALNLVPLMYPRKFGKFQPLVQEISSVQ